PSVSVGSTSANRGGRSPAGNAASHAVVSRISASGWTLSGWSAAETPPPPEEFACLAAVQRGSVGSLELRLRVDSQRSDANGWAASLEVVEAGRRALLMPLALAPGQALFWSLSEGPSGRLRLYAATACYRLAAAEAESPTVRTARGHLNLSMSAICLGSD